MSDKKPDLMPHTSIRFEKKQMLHCRKQAVNNGMRFASEYIRKLIDDDMKKKERKRLAKQN